PAIDASGSPKPRRDLRRGQALSASLSLANHKDDAGSGPLLHLAAHEGRRRYSRLCARRRQSTEMMLGRAEQIFPARALERGAAQPDAIAMRPAQLRTNPFARPLVRSSGSHNPRLLTRPRDRPETAQQCRVERIAACPPEVLHADPAAQLVGQASEL